MSNCLFGPPSEDSRSSFWRGEGCFRNSLCLVNCLDNAFRRHSCKRHAVNLSFWEKSQFLTSQISFLRRSNDSVRDFVCATINCGKGICQPSNTSLICFDCECDPGWKNIQIGPLAFTSCVVPNCDNSLSLSLVDILVLCWFKPSPIRKRENTEYKTKNKNTEFKSWCFSYTTVNLTN